MSEPARVGVHGEAIRARADELCRTVNDHEITLPEMEIEELAFSARVMVKWLTELLGVEPVFQCEHFESLRDKKRLLVARETIREIGVRAEEDIMERPNYQRRAERIKYGHDLTRKGES